MNRGMLFRVGGAAVGAFAVYQWMPKAEWYHYVGAGAVGYAAGAIADTALASAMPSQQSGTQGQQQS